MLDQSFSGSNFNIIFLKENRKGNIKERHLNQAYFDKHYEFNTVLNEKIDLKKSRALSIQESDSYVERLEEINKAKEEIRNNLFSEYANIVNNDKTPFCFEIKYDKQNKIYTTKKDGVHFFAIKQLQQNLSKTFKVIQADRNKIIKQTYNLISDGFPKVVIRTDIHKFYESIPQNHLFEKLENNTLISPLSKKLLKRLFYEFERIKDITIMQAGKGIPRGFGVSAYLSELYMREIDDEIKTLPDIIYYARYVDDIIAIFSPKTKSQIIDYKEVIKKIINKSELEINDNLEGRSDKTQNIRLLENPLQRQEKLEFLGYKFFIKQNQDIIIELSDGKINRYLNRIKLSIETYNKDSKYNESRARKMLFDRLKFLTCNYHLNHNKKNIKAGIFYSNCMLELNTFRYNSLNCLKIRMGILFKNIEPPLKIGVDSTHSIGIDKDEIIGYILNKFCFEKGFNEKPFYSFNFNKNEQRYYSKKFNRVTNKFEVIKSIWKNE
ncbi:antiviral reverse transcriptase Drt3a [Flavobacterium sp. XS2P39]|uniref:antiviral reverse transcriptase Drt3a n=1 Tax=Flavobacterium sp. XS2P39 TaxID=3401725 RepID=UPI003AAF9996